MGDYGPHSRLVEYLIQRAGSLSSEEAADVYVAHGTRLLLNGNDAQTLALTRARHVARSAGLLAQFERASSDAATAWRRAKPRQAGPWLLVSQAISNAAGALVLSDALDERSFQTLVGSWRQAVGTLVPVGPGSRTTADLTVPARGQVTVRRGG